MFPCHARASAFETECQYWPHQSPRTSKLVSVLRVGRVDGPYVDLGGTPPLQRLRQRSAVLLHTHAVMRSGKQLGGNTTACCAWVLGLRAVAQGAGGCCCHGASNANNSGEDISTTSVVDGPHSLHLLEPQKGADPAPTVAKQPTHN